MYTESSQVVMYRESSQVVIQKAVRLLCIQRAVRFLYREQSGCYAESLLFRSNSQFVVD